MFPKLAPTLTRYLCYYFKTLYHFRYDINYCSVKLMQLIVVDCTSYIQWLQPRVCTLIWLHTEPHLHTTMKPPPTKPHITTHSPLTERHIWIITTRCYSTYQHVAITSRSRQLLMMGTWLSETCWATNRREIKNKSDIKLVFLIHINATLRAC